MPDTTPAGDPQPEAEVTSSLTITTHAGGRLHVIGAVNGESKGHTIRSTRIEHEVASCVSRLLFLVQGDEMASALADISGVDIRAAGL